MMETEQVKLQAITIGNADFKDVIDSGTLFVDKTAKLAKLAQFKKVFLTRPRRFGKTLMLSTLQELFAHEPKITTTSMVWRFNLCGQILIAIL